MDIGQEDTQKIEKEDRFLAIKFCGFYGCLFIICWALVTVPVSYIIMLSYNNGLFGFKSPDSSISFLTVVVAVTIGQIIATIIRKIGLED